LDIIAGIKPHQSFVLMLAAGARRNSGLFQGADDYHQAI